MKRSLKAAIVASAVILLLVGMATARVLIGETKTFKPTVRSRQIRQAQNNTGNRGNYPTKDATTTPPRPRSQPQSAIGPDGQLDYSFIINHPWAQSSTSRK